jgi:hypothetical protein
MHGLSNFFSARAPDELATLLLAIPTKSAREFPAAHYSCKAYRMVALRGWNQQEVRQ